MTKSLKNVQENGILPVAIQSAIDGRLGMFEDRMAGLLYKLTVEMDMGLSTLADCVQLDEEYLRRQRGKSVSNVKRTNGLLTLEQRVKEREDASESEDQWHD